MNDRRSRLLAKFREEENESLVNVSLTPHQQPQSPRAQYSLQQVIGRGAYGVVYKALNKQTGKTVAVKVVDYEDDQQLQDSMMEIDLLKNLKHKNIVKYHGFIQRDRQLYIFLEYCAHGSLRDLVKSGGVSDHVVSGYVFQTLNGLVYLHGEGVIHRDIKAANLLLDSHGIVKLADFGVSTRVNSQDDAVYAGSPNWMAPEVMLGQGATTVSDVWSLGCTVVELLTGNPPYHNLVNEAACYAIVHEEYLIPDTFTEQCRSFLSGCFIKEVGRRPRAETLLKHPWVVGNEAADITSSTASSDPVTPPPKRFETEIYDKLSRFKELDISSNYTDDFVSTPQRLQTSVGDTPFDVVKSFQKDPVAFIDFYWTSGSTVDLTPLIRWPGTVFTMFDLVPSQLNFLGVLLDDASFKRDWFKLGGAKILLSNPLCAPLLHKCEVSMILADGGLEQCCKWMQEDISVYPDAVKLSIWVLYSATSLVSMDQLAWITNRYGTSIWLGVALAWFQDDIQYGDFICKTLLALCRSEWFNIDDAFLKSCTKLTSHSVCESVLKMLCICSRRLKLKLDIILPWLLQILGQNPSRYVTELLYFACHLQPKNLRELIPYTDALIENKWEKYGIPLLSELSVFEQCHKKLLPIFVSLLSREKWIHVGMDGVFHCGQALRDRVVEEAIVDSFFVKAPLNFEQYIDKMTRALQSSKELCQKLLVRTEFLNELKHKLEMYHGSLIIQISILKMVKVVYMKVFHVTTMRVTSFSTGIGQQKETVDSRVLHTNAKNIALFLRKHWNMSNSILIKQLIKDIQDVVTAHIHDTSLREPTHEILGDMGPPLIKNKLVFE